MTVSFAVGDCPPELAVMVAVCVLVTFLAVIVKAWVLEPDEIVTLERMVATAVLLLMSVTGLFAGAFP